MIGSLLAAAASTLAFAVEFNYRMDSARLIATISNVSILIGIIILYIFANFIL